VVYLVLTSWADPLRYTFCKCLCVGQFFFFFLVWNNSENLLVLHNFVVFITCCCFMWITSLFPNCFTFKNKKLKLYFYGLYSVFRTRRVHVKLTPGGSFSGHPWILFYTAQTLNTLPVKSKLKPENAVTFHKFVTAPESGFGGNRMDNCFLNGSSSFSSSESCNSEYDDDCEWIDALTTAVSHVTISEAKRTKLWGPTGPIDPQGSSNLKTNLCKAFWPTDRMTPTACTTLSTALAAAYNKLSPTNSTVGKSGFHANIPYKVDRWVPVSLPFIFAEKSNYINLLLFLCPYNLLE